MLVSTVSRYRDTTIRRYESIDATGRQRSERSSKGENCCRDNPDRCWYRRRPRRPKSSMRGDNRAAAGELRHRGAAPDSRSPGTCSATPTRQKRCRTELGRRARTSPAGTGIRTQPFSGLADSPRHASDRSHPHRRVARCRSPFRCRSGSVRLRLWRTDIPHSWVSNSARWSSAAWLCGPRMRGPTGEQRPPPLVRAAAVRPRPPGRSPAAREHRVPRSPAGAHLLGPRGPLGAAWTARGRVDRSGPRGGLQRRMDGWGPRGRLQVPHGRLGAA